MKAAPRCTCGECAELDLAYPGEGRQLALLLADRQPRRRRATQNRKRKVARA